MTQAAAPRPLDGLRRFLEGPRFNGAIVALIVVNAVTLGLETSPRVMAAVGPWLLMLDKAILSVFVLEIVLKLVAYRLRFFTNAWNLFDFAIVAISLVPATGNLSVLRALRILRVLRLISIVPSMRLVVEAMLRAMPGMGSIAGLLSIIFYVAAVMSTKLFGASFPDLFGTIGASMYTLFQIMTLEGWSGEVVRPVMEVYPYAWVFFIPFMILTTFMVLNLFIALIVNSMESIHREDRDDASAVVGELRALREEVAALRRELGK